MISRSSLGRLARNIFIRSRKRVTVRTLVAICWRRVAMSDYSLLGKNSCGDGRHGRPWRAKPASRASARKPIPITSIIAAAYIASEPPFGHLLELLYARREFASHPAQRSFRTHWRRTDAIANGARLPDHALGSRSGIGRNPD